MQANQVLPPRRVTKREASRRLGLPFEAINRMIESGDLKTIPSFGKVRAIIIESSVDAILARMLGNDQKAG